MEKNVDDADIQVAGFEALSRLVIASCASPSLLQEPDSPRSPRESTGSESGTKMMRLRNVMNRLASENTAMSKAYQLTTGALSGHGAAEDIVTKVGLLGGLDALINTMKQCELDTKQQEAGCQAFKFLTNENHANCGHLVELNGVEIIIKAMESDPSDLALQKAGLGAVANVLSHDSYTACSEISAPLATICCALKKHPQDVELQRMGIGALGNMHAEEDAEEVLKAGGFECITAAMQRELADSVLQEAGCRALGQLVSAFPAKAPEVTDKVVQLKMPKAIVTAMKQHSQGEDVSVILAGIAALKSMGSLKGTALAQVVTDGGLEVILNSLKAHNNEGYYDTYYDMLQIGSDTLTLITESSDAAQEKFRTLGGEKVLQEATRILANHKKPGFADWIMTKPH
jgi:hypothetical protein